MLFSPAFSLIAYVIIYKYMIQQKTHFLHVKNVQLFYVGSLCGACISYYFCLHLFPHRLCRCVRLDIRINSCRLSSSFNFDYSTNSYKVSFFLMSFNLNCSCKAYIHMMIFNAWVILNSIALSLQVPLQCIHDCLE